MRYVWIVETSGVVDDEWCTDRAFTSRGGAEAYALAVQKDSIAKGPTFEVCTSVERVELDD